MSKTIVITGSTRGIGLGMAREFLTRGNKVMVSGRSAASVEKALAELRPKALERKLHALVVTRLKQFINVLFWGAVAFIVKLLISVADQFENYAAKDVAKNVGQTLYVVFAIAIVAALAIGIIGFFTAAGFEESRRQDSDPSQQRKKADKSRPAKPATSAQSYIK